MYVYLRSKNMSSLTKVLIIFNIYVSCVYGQQLACNKNSEKRIDDIVSKITIIGNSGVKFPESQEDVLNHCNFTSGSVKILENYRNKCAKDLAKQVLGVLVYSGKTQLRQMCKKNSKRMAEIIEMGPCANAANFEFNKCITRSIDGLLGVQHADDKQKLPLTCCLLAQNTDCVEKSARKFPICTERIMTILNKEFNSISSNAVNLVCGEYTQDSNKCDNLVPPKRRKNQTRTKSMFFPLLKVLQSFPEA